MPKMTFERSPDIDAIAEILRGVNGFISYADLAKRSGRSLRRVMECHLRCRSLLKRTEMIWFGAVRGQGLQRLGPDDWAKFTSDGRKRVGRASNRALKRSVVSDTTYNSMSKTDQHTFTADRTILNIISSQARTRSEPPRPDPVKPEGAPLPDVGKIVGMNRRAQ